MTKEERNELKTKVNQFDTLERTISDAKILLKILDEYPLSAMREIADFFEGRSIEEIDSVRAAVRPIISQIIEECIAKLNALNVS